MEHLLYARHCSKYQDYNMNQESLSLQISHSNGGNRQTYNSMSGSDSVVKKTLWDKWIEADRGTIFRQDFS